MSASAALLSVPDSRTVLLAMVSHSSLVASSMSAASVCLGPDNGGSGALLGLAALLASEASLGSVFAESEYCLQAGAEAYSLACSQLEVALLRHGDLCRACLKLPGTQRGWNVCKLAHTAAMRHASAWSAQKLLMLEWNCLGWAQATHDLLTPESHFRMPSGLRCA